MANDEYEATRVSVSLREAMSSTLTSDWCSSLYEGIAPDSQRVDTAVTVPLSSIAHHATS